jgi:hypothetical protein
LDKQLNPGESVVVRARFSRLCHAPVLLTALVVMAAWAKIHQLEDLPLLVAGGAGFSLLLFLGRRLVLRTTVLAVATKRIIGKAGIFSRHFADAPPGKVNDATVRKGFFGLVFNFGEIKIAASPAFAPFGYVRDPDGFRSAFFAELDKNPWAVKGAPAPPAFYRTERKRASGRFLCLPGRRCF